VEMLSLALIVSVPHRLTLSLQTVTSLSNSSSGEKSENLGTYALDTEKKYNNQTNP